MGSQLGHKYMITSTVVSFGSHKYFFSECYRFPKRICHNGGGGGGGGARESDGRVWNP